MLVSTAKCYAKQWLEKQLITIHLLSDILKYNEKKFLKQNKITNNNNNNKDRIWKRDYRDERALQADPLYTQQLTLPQDMLDNPANCVTTKFIRAALNKDPRPVFCVCVSILLLIKQLLIFSVYMP